jgi:hypothetical protein
LRDEANEEDASAKRCRWDADEALRVHNSLQFEALCLALQRNDETTTKLANADEYLVGYAQRLGEALQNNTRVSELSIHIAKLIPSSFDEQQALSAIRHLLEYIRTSKAMRAVWIGHEHPSDDLNELLVKKLMNASLSQQARIEELTTSDCTLPILPFCKRLPSAMIKKLDVDLHNTSDNNPLSQEEHDAIRKAFRLSWSLQNLSLRTGDADTAVSVLVGLKAGAANDQYKLRKLKLQLNDELQINDALPLAYWIALSDFTRATTHLEQLEITTETFEDQTTMDAFLVALKPPSSISKLSLDIAAMRSDAFYSLKGFMETRKEGDETAASSLRELDFGCRHVDIVGPWSGSLFASMFCMKRDNMEGQWYSTVGSQLRALSVTPVSTGGHGFLKALALNAHLIKLKCLKLTCLNVKDCHDLSAFISATVTLEELDLDEMEDSHSILCSLRDNGSLRMVTIPGEMETHFVNVYCLRNTRLDPLLHNLTWTESVDGTTNLENVRCTLEDRRSLTLLPALLQSAKQITMAGASKVFCSLVNLGDSIGPI